METNWANRTLFHHDNLAVLRGMNSESVDLIATDPPFNKSKDFHATPDSLAAGASFQDRWSWEKDVHEEWTDQITDDYPRLMEAIESARYAHSDGMGAFMCFMAVRLLEMRRVLKPTGSIYLHCDPTASHYLKAVMDAVFGHTSFGSEIVWKRSGGKSDAKRWGVTTDRLLFYTSTDQHVWNRQYQPHDPEYIAKTYRLNDGDGRGPYTTMPLHASGIRHAESGEPWRNYSPGDKGNHWRTPTKGAMHKYIVDKGLIAGWPEAYPSIQSRLDALDKAGLIAWSSNNVPRLKTYLRATRGIAITDLIRDIPMASGCERTGFPTQKPLALYERIIRASSNEGDIVLDPFAGCATTCVAAEKLQRQWVGIDIWAKVYDIVIERLKDTTGLFGAVTFTDKPPDRTDDGQPAAPFLRTKVKIAPPPGPKMSRAKMYEHLLNQHGQMCQGCNRTFDDPRYLQLDHNTPRSQGGLNHLVNRILLCGPCNNLKSDIYTLKGLRRENKKRGYMAGQVRAKRPSAAPN